MSDTRIVEGVALTKQKQVGEVMVWKANQPLTDLQHKLVGQMLRREEKATGVKIMLIPFTVDAGAPRKASKNRSTAVNKD